MNNERFGGSLVAPYRTEEPEHVSSGTPIPDPADGRFGGTVAASYVPPVSEVIEEPVPVSVPVVEEPVPVVEPIEEPAPVVEDFVQTEELSGFGTELETLPGPEDFEDSEELHHVEDEHIPNDSKHFHGKNKKRR
jgi:hypothetical protein